MNRKTFLRRMGIAGAAAVFSKPLSHAKTLTPPPVCTLIPSETAGPYPLSLCGTTTYWRSDIRESQAGADFTITLRINGTANCGPLNNWRVDLWHCNALGYYSGYTTNGQNGSQNYSAARWLRGIQTTNSAGEVTFLTKFPGWYSGRIIHIHFQIFSGGAANSCSGWTLVKTSQLTFPIAEKNALLAANAPYNIYGPDPTSLAQDNVFNDGYDLQMATLAGSGVPYSSELELAVPGTGGVAPLELLGFNGGLKGENALLWWRTTNETNFSHFEIQYGIDGEDFETVGRVNAKGMQPEAVNDYSFEHLDIAVFGNAFYRLKMVDFGGTEAFSSMVVVANQHKIPVRIHPNPAVDHLMLSHPRLRGVEKIVVMDSQCREIAVGHLEETDSEFTRINIEVCKKGIHFLAFFDGQDTQVIKFLVN